MLQDMTREQFEYIHSRLDKCKCKWIGDRVICRWCNTETSKRGYDIYYSAISWMRLGKDGRPKSR